MLKYIYITIASILLSSLGCSPWYYASPWFSSSSSYIISGCFHDYYYYKLNYLIFSSSFRLYPASAYLYLFAFSILA